MTFAEPGGPAGPAGSSGSTGGPLAVLLEPRVANAVWTRIANVLDGIDVGVGGRFAWVLTKDGSSLRIDAWTGQNVLAYSALTSDGAATRITASSRPPKDPQDEGGLVLFDSGNLWLEGSSFFPQKVVSEPVLVDVSAQEFTGTQLNAGGSFDVYSVALNGGLFGLVGTGWPGGFAYWAPIALPLGVSAVAVATARKYPGQTMPAGLSEIWFVRGNDDEVVNLVDPTIGFGPSPGGAWDIGAGGNGVLWAIGAYASPDGHGNILWRFDHEAARFDLIPGGGAAVDVDVDGNAWVLDDSGQLDVRGLRILGVTADEPRGEPKKGETWTEYFIEYVLQAFEAGALSPLSAQSAFQARSVGAGGTTHLIPWDDNFQNSVTRLGPYLSKDVGFDTLLSVAPIFTNLAQVPSAIRAINGVVTDVPAIGGGSFPLIDFSNSALVLAYAYAVSAAMALPGFRDRVRYVSIGNEIDHYYMNTVAGALGTAAAKNALSTQYKAFCTQVIKGFKENTPFHKVGICLSYAGIKDQSWRGDWYNLLAGSDVDVVIATYYAVDQSYSRVGPNEYTLALDELLAFAKYVNKPLVIQEIGMPSFGTSEGEQAQVDFLEYIFNWWQKDEVRGWVRFLSWWPLYDYFYDPVLQVAQDPLDPAGVDAPFYVTTSSPVDPITGKPAVPKEILPGWPFVGAGNLLAPFFNGARPGKDPKVEKTLNNADTVYWLNASTTQQYTRAFCRYLSTCGLINSDGSTKKSWDTYRNWALQLQTQGA